MSHGGVPCPAWPSPRKAKLIIFADFNFEKLLSDLGWTLLSLNTLYGRSETYNEQQGSAEFVGYF